MQLPLGPPRRHRNRLTVHLSVWRGAVCTAAEVFAACVGRLVPLYVHGQIFVSPTCAPEASTPSSILGLASRPICLSILPNLTVFPSSTFSSVHLSLSLCFLSFSVGRKIGEHAESKSRLKSGRKGRSNRTRADRQRRRKVHSGLARGSLASGRETACV